MSKNGNKILESFYKKLNSLSLSEQKNLKKIVDAQGGTFAGAAWSMYRNKRYSPHKSKTQSPHKSKTRSPKRSVRKPKSGVKTPYIKQLKPGIRTIMFKST